MKKTPVFCLCLAVACSPEEAVEEFVSSTFDQPWIVQNITVGNSEDAAETIVVNSCETAQTIEGFGVCFSELGWQSLGMLPETERKAVLEELFKPGLGANLTINRTPIGGNDFSLDWYSYNDVEGDFAMENFSIEHDLGTLVSLIKDAQAINPEMKIWATPWCPPTWMKRNRHYAMRPDPAVNDLPEARRGYEGEDMFIQEEPYFEAYALYFEKYIKAYKEQGIDIFMVMPQNEPNSDQNFPSCCWTSKGLVKFMKHLAPKMSELGVDLYFGTCERPSVALIDTVLTDPEVGKYIKGAGFQWAGRSAVSSVKENYPSLELYMTEQECGDGKNDWAGALHSWELLKHYLSNGVNVYDYWNISLVENGLSRWAWRQNSLVVVNPEEKTSRYSIEYYLLKHASHYVLPGAKLIKTDPSADALAFINTDGSIITILANETDAPKTVSLVIDGKTLCLTLQPQSFNTLKLR